MTINLADHIMNLKGREYLPVAPRIVAFREANPAWSIMTEPVDIRDSLYCKALILADDGRVVATAHKVVTSFAGGAFEKAETGAIGRALSLCGYGTLAAQDMDEGEDIADSPAPPRRTSQPAAPPAKAAAKPAAAPATDPHFTARIAAATTSAAVDELLTEIARIDNPYHRKAAEKLAHARQAELAPTHTDPSDLWVADMLLAIDNCQTQADLAALAKEIAKLPPAARDALRGPFGEAQAVLKAVAA